jgi:hypothetical protein
MRQEDDGIPCQSELHNKTVSKKHNNLKTKTKTPASVTNIKRQDPA